RHSICNTRASCLDGSSDPSPAPHRLSSVCCSVGRTTLPDPLRFLGSCNSIVAAIEPGHFAQVAAVVPFLALWWFTVGRVRQNETSLGLATFLYVPLSLILFLSTLLIWCPFHDVRAHHSLGELILYCTHGWCLPVRGVCVTFFA